MTSPRFYEFEILSHPSEEQKSAKQYLIYLVTIKFDYEKKASSIQQILPNSMERKL